MPVLCCVYLIASVWSSGEVLCCCTASQTHSGVQTLGSAPVYRWIGGWLPHTGCSSLLYTPYCIRSLRHWVPGSCGRSSILPQTPDLHTCNLWRKEKGRWIGLLEWCVVMCLWSTHKSTSSTQESLSLVTMRQIHLLWGVMAKPIIHILDNWVHHTTSLLCFCCLQKLWLPGVLLDSIRSLTHPLHRTNPLGCHSNPNLLVLQCAVTPHLFVCFY